MKMSTSVIVAGICGCVVGSMATAQLVSSQGSNPLEGTLSHVSFAVRDVDHTAQVFADVFGVEAPPSTIYRDIPYGPRFPGKVMHAKSTNVRVNGVSFEFIEPLEGDSPWKDFIDERGEGIHHVGFNVPNVQQAREALEAKGGTWTQAYMDFAAYVDMQPVLPITFEVTPGAPPGGNR